MFNHDLIIESELPNEDSAIISIYKVEGRGDRIGYFTIYLSSLLSFFNPALNIPSPMVKKIEISKDLELEVEYWELLHLLTAYRENPDFFEGKFNNCVYSSSEIILPHLLSLCKISKDTKELEEELAACVARSYSNLGM